MTTAQLASEIQAIKELLQEQSPRPLSLPEAAEYLNVSRSYLYRLTSTASIRHFKTQGGKKITFLKADLDKWLTAHRVKTREELAAEVTG